jgi:hypothetical protein
MKLGGVSQSLGRARGSLFLFNLTGSWTPRFARRRSRSSTWPVKRLLVHFRLTRALPNCGSRQLFHGLQRPIAWCFPAVWKMSAATDWERRWIISQAFSEGHARVPFPSGRDDLSFFHQSSSSRELALHRYAGLSIGISMTGLHAIATARRACG